MDLESLICKREGGGVKGYRRGEGTGVGRIRVKWGCKRGRRSHFSILQLDGVKHH